MGDPNSVQQDRQLQEEELRQNIGALPPGWHVAFHYGPTVFFINHNDQTTQWEHPRFQNQRISGNVGEEERLSQNIGALPPGWNAAFHYGPTVYFHNEQTIQWEYPRIPSNMGSKGAVGD